MTGCPVQSEVPKSKRSTPHSQVPNCTDERLVQPELVAHGRELLRVDVAGLVAAQDQQRHVPRDHAHDQEHHRRHPEQGGDDQQEPLGEVGAHAAAAQSSESQTSWSFWLV